ncbi:MAG: acylphosphatase [Rhizobium sp.]|nr:MAG: acylphosphatase [Rhizobium sp.]
MTPQCYRFLVTGRVQGVYFRQSTADQARQLGLDGWVRNLPDGRVEGVASGEQKALETLKAWLHHGPPAARVDDLQWTSVAETVARGFEVRR